MSASKILFFLCVSFVVGVFTGSLVKIPQVVLAGFLFVAVLLIFISTARLFSSSQEHWNRVLVVGFCALFLMLGVLRVQISDFNIANDKISKLWGKDQVILIGTVYDTPDVRETSQKLKVKIQDSKSIILVTTKIYPEYNHLDTIKITGKVEQPLESDDFNYKNYLMKDHIYSVMGFPKIEILSQKHSYNLFSYLYDKILFLRQKMRQSIQSNFLPPQSSILQGIILGDKSAVSQDIKDKFRATGLSHIIAVSGTHVVILSSIIMSFLVFLGLWRQQSFWLAVLFICSYVALAGFPASGVRAGIMGIIYLAGQTIGRQTMSLRIIVLAAALMLLVNPLLLFYDVGFQLSFLAILGLVYLEPGIRNFIKSVVYSFLKIKINEKYENVLMMFSVTISAQIFTMPIIIYNFGSVSVISPVTNILVMPIIYYLMFFGFLSAILGMLWSFLGWILYVPCYFLMTYFLWVIDIFAKPWACKTISGVSWIWVLFFYLVIGLLTWFLNKEYSKDFL